MAIRLCQACLHEINEGDKLCSNCNVSVNRHATVIEVMSEYEGFSYVSNRYAYHDENLNNYKHEPLKDSKNSRLYPDNIPIKKKTYDVNDVILDEEDDDNFVENFIRMIKNPTYYFDVLMGLIGALLLIIGDISSIYCDYEINKEMASGYFSYMNSLIMAIGLVAVLLVLKHKKKYVLIPALSSVTLLTFALSNAEGVKNLGIGYFIMWLATVMLVISAVVSNQSKFKKYFLEKTDLIWILLTFFISLGLANTLNHYYAQANGEVLETESGILKPGTVNIPKEEIKIFDIKNNEINIQISLLDSYLVSFKNKDMIVVELSAYNYGDKSIKLDEFVDIKAEQNDEIIGYENDINNITYFDMNAKNNKIEANKCNTMFYGFFIGSEGDITLKIYDKTTSEPLINQMLTVNSKFYVSTTVSGIPDGDSDIIEEAKNNQITNWDIYFVKPDSWSNDVCAYIYYLDKNKKVKKLEEWPGKPMRKEEDYYILSYDKKWYGKARVIIVDKNNTNNRFPENSSAGIVLEGNLNVTPKQ